MDTEVDVPNPSLTLVPGLYAEVRMKIDQRKDALCVPLDAIERSGESARVYTVQDSVIHAVPVSLGLESAQRIEVLSGLEPGQSVIVGRLAGLKDGQKVRPEPATFDTQGK